MAEAGSSSQMNLNKSTPSEHKLKVFVDKLTHGAFGAVGSHATRMALQVSFAVAVAATPVISTACALAGMMDFGVGLFTLIKMREILSIVREGREKIQALFEGQTYLVALYSRGQIELSSEIEKLTVLVEKGFSEMFQTIRDEAARDRAMKYSRKCKKAEEDYFKLIELSTSDAVIQDDIKRRHTERAKNSAVDLFNWAMQFVRTRSQESEREILLYIMAMAFAVKVKMDACSIESNILTPDTVQATLTPEARRIVEEFQLFLGRQLVRLTTSLSLAEIGLELGEHVMEYIKLIQGYYNHLHAFSSPEGESERQSKLMDELKSIRELFYRVCNEDSETENCSIDLVNLQDKVWLVKFTSTDMTRKDVSFADRSSVGVIELCLALGMNNNMDLNKLRIKKENKSKLLSLRPAQKIRSDLLNEVKLALSKVNNLHMSLDEDRFARIQIMADLEGIFPDHLVCEDRSMRGHDGPVHDIVVCGKYVDRAATCGSDGTIRIWSLYTGHQKMVLRRKEGGPALCLAPTRDREMIIAGFTDGSVVVWQLSTGKVQDSFTGHKGAVRSLATLPEKNEIISAGVDGMIKIWNTKKKPSETAFFFNHRDSVSCLCLASDGNLLISGSVDTTIKVWDMNLKSLDKTLSGHKGPVLTLAMTTDSRRAVSGGTDNTIRIWNLEDGTQERVCPAHVDCVRSLAFSPKGDELVSAGGDKTIKVWNLDTGRVRVVIAGHTKAVTSIVLVPTRQEVDSADASRRQRTLRGGYELLQSLPVEQEMENMSAYTEDRKLISASADGTIRTWPFWKAEK